MNMHKILINGTEFEVTENIATVYHHFSKKTETMLYHEIASQLIVKIFSITYINDIYNYYSDDKISRSNWTHHTANTFFRTCQILNFLCDFEVENRHDGAIRDSHGNVFLAAEWEYDTNSIFNNKGEIVKLYNTCKKHHNADAMLFTYKVETDYVDYVDKVFDFWNSLLDEQEEFSLFLLTALFKKDENNKVNIFYGLRTIEFGNKTVDIWEDYTHET